ncbi:unnamed protein product [Anisakis simplex]|uniref:Dihydroxyacetone phosphate acyltransferase (inferred by orthology to a human protein) n=1 Tax=Anisakis simplex TaxID=6269 RepID=A0A0M3JYA5_ANISI|nr:unnamed protein product [Anisakis simplex]
MLGSCADGNSNDNDSNNNNVQQMEKIDNSEVNGKGDQMKRGSDSAGGAVYVDWLAKVDEVGGGLAWETISTESEARGLKDEKMVLSEARRILEEMTHRMHLPAMRCIGYGIVSVVKKLFDGVFVNIAQLERIKEMFKNDVVVFMPTHRTYMDFLLVSLLCFDMDMPLPIIAAGMDFMNSKLMGEALRRCGAFFIRRMFGNRHLMNADYSLEFFVEGTRSRSGKSLHPKYGLLNVVVEPFLRCKVFDMKIVPVTINYDKILEEKLYAYELLGFPKPRESTSGLLKALRIMNEKFGRVYMTFGEAISLRDYFRESLPRSAFARTPSDHFELSTQQKAEVRKLGHHIVCVHNRNNITSIWPYACVILLKLLQEAVCSAECSHSSGKVQLSDLSLKLNEFVGLARKLQKRIHIQSDVNADLRYYLRLHSDLFNGLDKWLGSSQTDCTQQIQLELVRYPVPQESFISRECLERSVAHVILSNYANQVYNEFVDISLLCTIVTVQNGIHYEDAEKLFCRSREMFEHEFVCVPGRDEGRRLFQGALDVVRRVGLVRMDSQRNIFVYEDEYESVAFLAELVHVILLVGVQRRIVDMLRLEQTRIEDDDDNNNMKSNCEASSSSSSSLLCVSKHSDSKMALSKAISLSSLSSDPIKNAWQSFVSQKILIKNVDDGQQQQYVVSAEGLCEIWNVLNSISPFTVHKMNALKSKL